MGDWSESLEQLMRALYADPAWARFAVVLRVFFMLCLARVLWLLIRSGRREGEAGSLRFHAGYWMLLVLPFVGVLAYQASWQLAGFARPKFVRFMQLYDRRQFNPAHTASRGRILDAKGRILAYSVEINGKSTRQYPHGPAFAHTIGYSDPFHGFAGVEGAANTTLSGGRYETREDWEQLGRDLLAGKARARGADVRLTLDIDLQRAAYDALAGRAGAVVALEPATGAILVMTSSPSYDPNHLHGGLFTGDPSARVLNRAAQGVYPPGSTFKAVVAAAAIRTGNTGPLDCPADGYTTSSRYPRIRDHEYYEARDSGGRWSGYGRLDLPTAFAKSSNVYFAQLGVKVGLPALRETAQGFGFGELFTFFAGSNRTMGFSVSRIPDLSRGDLYGLAQISIGQGKLVVSPAQMALVCAAVANHGELMRPRLEVSQPPQLWRPAMTRDQAGAVGVLMRRVVTSGTGRPLASLPFACAGKTGTAENPRGAAHAWFIGYAPYDRPRVAVAVIVENGGYGSSAALPVARAVFERAAATGLFAQQGGGPAGPR